MARPPARPSYILRGHGSQIHATAFIRGNSRLVTGDAEGWVIIWDLAIKRPTAVWRAHQASILGLSAWGSDVLITHGKDNELILWKFSVEDEESMSAVLPLDTSPEMEPRKQPWLLYILNVNTMNFCSFAQTDKPRKGYPRELLIAVPNTLSSETVDIFHLPSTTRLHTIPASPLFKGGMVMSLSLFYQPITSKLTVITAFESGHTSINQLAGSTWTTLYVAQSHTQPILSLAVAPDKSFYLTSSADAIIAQHSIPCIETESPDLSNVGSSRGNSAHRVINTKHSGQQGLQIRNDGRIFATAGWDGKARIYSCKTLRELAVLKWHQEGCYAVAFTNVSTHFDCYEDDTSNESETSIALATNSNKNIVESARSTHLMESDPSLIVHHERIWKAWNTHWVAVGAKDGKVSLWDIY